MQFTIILYKPENPGNIGAVARAMKNFGFDKLALVEPSCDHLSKEALDRATHAKPLLKKAAIMMQPELKKFDTLIATTSQLGNDYNVSRSPITPKQLAELPLKGNIGLLFGPEAHGLSNKEIRQCEFVVTIPATKGYPVMNLSHAAAILLYELSQRKTTEKAASHIIPASVADKQQLEKLLQATLDTLPFTTVSKKETQKKIWKRMIGKSFLTRREAFALMGFFKKMK